jgi:hypothetical protein
MNDAMLPYEEPCVLFVEFENIENTLMSFK